MPGECPAASRTAGLPPGAPAFLDQLAEFIEDFISVNQLSTFRLGRASFELDLELLKTLFPFFLLSLQEPKSLSNHFASGLVSARLHSALKERVEFRRKRYIHGR